MAAPPIIVDVHSPLLVPEDTVDGAVDYQGSPAIRSKHGRWRSAAFIIGVEVAERVAYYGIASNLINYLTGPLEQPMATAAANVNAWSGIGSLLPVVGAVVADSCLGRYRTIVISSIIYILGLGLLTLSAMLLSTTSSAHFQVFAIFFSLYLVAIGQAGHKPCTQAFGADQFDAQDPQEAKAKSSFFNWWYFGASVGPLVLVNVMNYVQDNLDWALGFGIPCIIMAIALVVFLLGSATYRHIIKVEEQSAFVRIGRVFAAAARNWHVKQSDVDVIEEAQGILPHDGSEQFRFLNKALVPYKCAEETRKACTITEVEEAKAVLRLFPIWATSLIYAIVFSQYSTFFTKQGVTMDRSLGPSFTVPSASLQTFVSLSIVLFIPIYERIFVPIARTLTRKPAGITLLQRIGTGMFVSIIAMVVAALVERKRLETALEHGLIDSPNSTVPMSVWWLVPQYALFGVADVFTMVGLQEFFYDQVPTELRSVGLSLYLSVFGVGSLLSSLLVSLIDKFTSTGGRDSWFANNLNRAHLDYFYWLLASISVVEIASFYCFSKSYIYNAKNGL